MTERGRTWKRERERKVFRSGREYGCFGENLRKGVRNLMNGKSMIVLKPARRYVEL